MKKKDIRYLIKIYGSQREVAKVLGVNQSTVSRLLSKKIKNPNKDIKNKVKARNKYYQETRIVRYTLKVKIHFFKQRHSIIKWISTDYTTLRDLESAYDNLLFKLQQSGTVVHILDKRLETRKLTD